MSTHVTIRHERNGQTGSGLAPSIMLHIVLAGAIVAATIFTREHTDRWGENASSVGAIQASMVSAIPLPSRVPPVKDNVLAPDNVSPAPLPPPTEEAAPPPKDTDILIKAKTPEKPVTKVAPIPSAAPPRHPQPTPVTPKAMTGEAATQLPQSISQVKNGTATATVQDRTFGNRYAYYVRLVSSKVADQWYTWEADPRSSQGKRVTLTFDIERDGAPTNVRIQTPSGSPSLDTSALRALQRVDTFGPLPGADDHITVVYTFDYRQQ